jgi:Flp pilus assembly protein TadG
MNRPTWRRGAALIYISVAMFVFMGMTSLVVDCARVRVVKMQLQAAADAAARYAVTGLPVAATARSKAVTSAGENSADGTPVVVDSTLDVDIGIWDSSTKTFTVLTGVWEPSATAVRVTARRTSARGNAISTYFGKLVGMSTVNVTVSAVAAIGGDHQLTISALCCPWLAGMPDGTVITGAGNGSNAPTESPLQVGSFPIVPGRSIQFRNTTGQTADIDSGGVYGLDGSPTRVTIQQASVNGINSTTGPLNALMGIFLDDNAPNSTSANPALDYSTSTARDFTTASPMLKQVFFIGDGLTSTNQLQNFVIPQGATRLYLGVMDEKGHWYDNLGSITTTVYDGQITLVQ